LDSRRGGEDMNRIVEEYIGKKVIMSLYEESVVPLTLADRIAWAIEKELQDYCDKCSIDAIFEMN